MINFIKQLPSHYRSKIHPLLVVIPLTVWGLYLRFQFRAQTELWADEIFQAKLCAKPFFQFLKELPKADFCKYLNGDYLLTYPFFQVFQYNKWGLAIPHIVITMTGFVFLYLICRRQFTSIWGYLVTFTLFSLNTSLIRHAFEIRPYAVLAVLPIVVYYFIDVLYSSQGALPRGKKLSIGAFFVLTIWFHPYGMVILFFISLYLLAVIPTDREQLKKVFKDIVPFFAVCLAVALPLWLYSVVFSETFDIGETRDVFLFIPNPLVDGIGFAKGVICNMIGQKWLYGLFIGLVIAFAMPQRDRLKQIGFFLLLVIIPIQLILLMDVHSYYWFVQRQFIWVMPMFLFLLGWCWESSILFVIDKLKGRGTKTK